MSKENHPNLHAVAFMIDITKSLENNLRGRGAEIRGSVLTLMLPRIKAFVDEIDELIDTTCEFTKFSETTKK